MDAKEKMLSRILFLLMICMLPGCSVHSWLPAAAGTPCGTTENLSERIGARWDALRAVDMQTVFSFSTPAYREFFDLLHINNQYAAQIQREELTIEKIDVSKLDGECLAHVSSTMSYRLKNDDSLSKYKLKGSLKQQWLYTDGQWWYVEPR